MTEEISKKKKYLSFSVLKHKYMYFVFINKCIFGPRIRYA